MKPKYSKYSEQTLELVCKLHQRRAELRDFLGSSYDDTVWPYRAVIVGLSAENKLGLLDNAIDCAKNAAKFGEPLTPSLFLVAYLEERESPATRDGDSVSTKTGAKMC